MRLIDADALLNDLKASAKDAREWKEETQDEEIKIRAEQTFGTFVECALRVKNAPTIEAEPVQHWIPCSERLPENDAKCLVYTSDKRICMAKWNEKYDGQGAWYIISDYAPKLYRIKNVPFWMPLPEPPEGGADDAAD